MVTIIQDDGTYTAIETAETKIVCVRPWAGIMTYFGLASVKEIGWSTLRWLRVQAGQAANFGSPEEFANHVARTLQHELSRMTLRNPISKGIGIHFTAYENIDGYLIPELFAITNFFSTTYQELLPAGARVTRETYGVVASVNERPPEHRLPQYRHQVRTFLDRNHNLVYNNGDPSMFNTAFQAIGNLISLAAQRHALVPIEDTKEHRALAYWPIEIVASTQRRFFKAGFRMVGGKPHNLSVTPEGIYESDTGDNC
jgi:hypothetical protein